MDENLTVFADVTGGCERILRTPIPLRCAAAGLAGWWGWQAGGGACAQEAARRRPRGAPSCCLLEIDQII